MLSQLQLIEKKKKNEVQDCTMYVSCIVPTLVHNSDKIHLCKVLMALVVFHYV